MGKVYLVGAGPGDFKLITLRALELIQQADVIIYDNLANKELITLAKDTTELIYAGKKASQHELPQKDINALLLKKARKNGVVVRLKGGDPFIFGRGGEEAEYLSDHGVECEVVPGVTSAISVPAYAGIPLTHRDYASTVAFITGHEGEKKTTSTIRWHELAEGPETLVFLMGIKNLRTITERLIREGKDPETPACIIQSGTLPTQKVVTGKLSEIGSLAKQAGIKPPGIIIVGNVVSLRKKLEWFEKRPLFGKKIAVTRALHQSMRLSKLLSDKGAQVIHVPTIEISVITPNSRLLNAIDSLGSYYCIIFTSVNGASVFFDALYKKGKDARSLQGIKIIPIGEATASLLTAKGIIPDHLPGQFTSEGIIDVLKGLTVMDKRFLLPRAKEARDIIVEFIKAKGGACDVVPVYTTRLPKKIRPLDQRPDIVTFTSSSTVTNFVKLYGKDALKDAHIASIGPVTTKTLKTHGLQASIEAKRYDIPGLVEAIEEYFK
jgi:uroporphyrinogen III methyltransferase/synthase